MMRRITPAAGRSSSSGSSGNRQLCELRDRVLKCGQHLFGCVTAGSICLVARSHCIQQGGQRNVRQNGARSKRAAFTCKRDWYAHSHVARADSMLAQRFSMDCSRSAISLLRVAITRAAAAAVAVTAVAAVESGKLPLCALPPVPPVRTGGDACHGCTPRPLPTAGCGGVRSRLSGRRLC